jgi:CRP-like cAMP-binding protein
MPASTPVGGNLLLRRLGASDIAVLEPGAKIMTMTRGLELHHARGAIDHVFFPLSGMISILAVMKTGEQIETAIVGREGAVGGTIGVFGAHSFGQAIVQVQGEAWRVPRASFLKLYNASEAFRRIMNDSLVNIFAQTQQSAACHALHTVEERLCRWLLQSRDLLGSDTIELTQEFLSHILGVQRTAVTLNANALQKRGLIHYSRGVIRIVDVTGLRAASCECYEAVRAG